MPEIEVITATKQPLKTIPAYSYDGRTGIYNGETVADESPLEPGVYLVPRHATVTAPPDDIPVGFAAFWRFADGWKIEAVPVLDEDLDGAQDTPQGFKAAPEKPGIFARMVKAIKGT